MWRRCCICKLILGEKEPKNDKSFTDTYCQKCYDVAMEDLKLSHKRNNINIECTKKMGK